MNIAMNVNIARMVPDARDGLVPVRRRILYAMYKTIKDYNKTVKSATVVGEVLGHYHPHGDASVYGSLVAMAQDWKIGMKLVEPQGSFGNILGKEAAHMRYTESAISEFAWDCCFSEWQDSLIDFKPNFSGTEKEPEFIPTKYPLALFSCLTGIGYGIYSGIPPYNFNEVMDALIELIKNPNKKKVKLIPDFPCGCQIVNTDFDAINAKGEGTLTLRGKIEEDENGDLHIRSIPYGVTLEKIIDEQIPELVEKGKINMFQNMINLSSKDRNDDSKFIIDVKLIMKKGADTKLAKEVLYKSTSLETSFTVIIKMVYNYQVNHYSLKSYLLDWLEFRRDYKRRVKLNEYISKSKKLHMLNCIIDIISRPDSDKKLYPIMRKSKNKAEIAKKLIKEFGITDLQADVISNFKMYQLSIESLATYKAQKEELDKLTKRLYKEIHDDSVIDAEMIKEFEEAKKKYKTPRKSEIIDVEDEAIDEELYDIIITKKGYIKKVLHDYECSSKIEPGDKITNHIIIQNNEDLLLFDSKGKVYSLPVSDIPAFPLEAVGNDINNYVNISNKIIKILRKPSEEEYDNYLIMVTKKGFIKKSKFVNYASVKKNGLIAMSLKEIDNEKDSLIDVIQIKKDKDILIYTSNGKAIRFNTKEIPTTLRMASGITAIKLDDEDKVLGIHPIVKNKKYLVLMTDKGNGKKVEIDSCTKTSRAGKDYKLITLDSKEKIVDTVQCDDKDEISILFNNRIETINAKDIKLSTKIAKAKKLVTCKKSEQIIGITT